MPTVTAKYPVKESERIMLDVIIGDGQAGGSAAFIGPEEKAAGPRIEGVNLGEGSDLRGKVLVVSSTVVDIRPEHDRTSVTVTLRGGYPDEFPIVQTATTTPSGAANYLTVVTFV